MSKVEMAYEIPDRAGVRIVRDDGTTSEHSYASVARMGVSEFVNKGVPMHRALTVLCGREVAGDTVSPPLSAPTARQRAMLDPGEVWPDCWLLGRVPPNTVHVQKVRE